VVCGALAEMAHCRWCALPFGEFLFDQFETFVSSWLSVDFGLHIQNSQAKGPKRLLVVKTKDLV
jgi:hypothetical protein